MLAAGREFRKYFLNSLPPAASRNPPPLWSDEVYFAVMTREFKITLIAYLL